MGWFGSKSSDSKARIEELKKKIQAEQAAMAVDTKPPAAPPPPPIAAAPVAVQPPAPAAPPPQPAPSVAQQAIPPQYQQQAWPTEPVRPPQRPVFAEPAYEMPREQPRRVQPIPDLLEETYMEEIKTGIVLDLGDGMSLNLPIRSRMRLDEFLHIADRVRELQKVQNGHF